MGRTKRVRKRRRAKADESLHGIYDYLYSFNWKNNTHIFSRYFPDTGRGLLSKNGIEEGELIIKIPFEALITLYNLECDEVFRQTFLPVLETLSCKLSYQSLISIYILFHKHQGTSRYKSYINYIPKHFTNPFFCSQSELYFIPENILKETVEQFEKIKSNYECLKRVLNEIECNCCNKLFSDIFTIDAFKWAYFAVNSRCVYINPQVISNRIKVGIFRKFLSDEPSFALAPLLDLLNHSNKAKTINKVSTSLKDPNKCYYELYSLKRYKKYEQIFISYGDLNNLKLLVDYGFFIKGNKNNFFQFSLSDIEGMINSNKDFRMRNISRNKFKFIRDHSLDDQMFVNFTDGFSHNLQVTFYVLFKVESYFPNILNQYAFGFIENLYENIKEEAFLLLKYKIFEYTNYVQGLQKIVNISDSGKVCLEYLLECISYLEKCLNKIS